MKSFTSMQWLGIILIIASLIELASITLFNFNKIASVAIIVIGIYLLFK